MMRKPSTAEFHAKRHSEVDGRLKVMKRIGFCVLLMAFCSGLHASQRVASPLELKLTTRTANVCFGESLQVEAELVNASDEQIVIDVKTIWYQLAFNFFRARSSRTHPDRSGSGTNTAGSLTRVRDAGPKYEGEYAVLRPGESYKATGNIELDDDFFKSRGGYDLKVTYCQFLDAVFQEHTVWKGTVESEELNFKIVSCRAAGKNLK
jgi:hypothetical protein